MATKNLSFLLFGEDVTASRAFAKVATSAEKSGAVVKKSFGGTTGLMGAAGLVVGLGLAVKGAANFQTAMTRLVTAGGESQANLAMVSKGVMAVSSATGTGLHAAGDAMYYIESAGFHGARGLAVLKAAAQGAKVEGVDTAKVADALTTALNDLGKHAGPPAQVMSQLVATVAHGKMTMDDLAGSLHSVLPNATAIGLSFGQVAGAIATMTAQGISADQATQNLNHAILSLANPTAVQTKAMAAFGLNSSYVARDLGQKGLTGTLEELSSTILQHMGPAGLTLTNALNTSQIAAGKVTEGYKAMTPEAQKYFDGIVSGKTKVQMMTAGMGTLTLAQDTQVKQLVVLYKRAHGFSDLLKSGAPDALTYAAALSKMTGGATGLQVALHLTGDNMSTFKSNVNDISSTTSDAAGNVKDFAIQQQTFNGKLADLKVAAENAGVAFGTKMLPALTSVLGFLLKHQTDVEIFVGALLGIKTALYGIKLAQEVSAGVSTVYMAAQKLLGGTAATSAVGINAEAAAVERLNLANAGGVGGAAAGGVAGAASKGGGGLLGKLPLGVGGGVLGGLGLALITSGDQSQIQKWQDAMDKLQSTYPNVKKLGVDAFGTLATAMQRGTITVDEYKDALRAGNIQVANNEATIRKNRDAVVRLNDANQSAAYKTAAAGAAAEHSGPKMLGAAAAAEHFRGRVAGLGDAVSRLRDARVNVTVDTSQAYYALEAFKQEAASAQAAAQIVGSVIINPQHAAHASGGYLDSGWNLVGEQGPEMINSNGRVMSASDTHRARSGGQGMTVNIHVTQPLGTPGQIAQAVIPALRMAYKNGAMRP